VLLGATAGNEPFMPRLVRLEAAAALPEMAHRLADETVAVNAVLLEYADEPALRLNAHLALLRHPEMSRLVLPLFGGEPEFRAALGRYGPAVLPPIVYFMTHEVRSVDFMRAAGAALSEAKAAALRILGIADDDARDAPLASALEDLAPVERGWYAIAFINEEGHDFLGQFVVGGGGTVEWVQTERISEAATAFFTSGIRTLETRYRLDEAPSPSDYLWAGVDVALVAGAVKVLRAGRAAAGAETVAGASARASLAARTVVRAGRGALRAGRYGVPLAVAYAVVRHPSLISGLAAQAANILGWPVPLVQGAAWFLVLMPVLLVGRWVLRGALRPCAVVLGAAARGAARLEAGLRVRRRPDVAPAPGAEPGLDNVTQTADPRSPERTRR
jgi:hypothetical protein